MSLVSAIWAWLISWGEIALCGVSVVALCWRCGFPLKHRDLPPLDAIVSVIYGTFLSVSGGKLLLNARSLSIGREGLFVPIVVAGFVAGWAGLSGILRGFKKALSESPLPPPAKTDRGDQSSSSPPDTT